MDENNSNRIAKYRKDIKCSRNWYLTERFIIIALCLACVGYLTYLVGGNSKCLEVDLLTKTLLIIFIILALILAGFVIFRMPIYMRRVQTAIARLDALDLRVQLETEKKNARIAETEKSFQKDLSKVEAATQEAEQIQRNMEEEVAKIKAESVINIDRELQLIVRILES